MFVVNHALKFKYSG